MNIGKLMGNIDFERYTKILETVKHSMIIQNELLLKISNELDINIDEKTDKRIEKINKLLDELNKDK